MTENTPLLNLGAVADRVFQVAARSCREALTADAPGARLPELVGDANRFADAVVRSGVENSPPRERPACCIGCAACCHLHVVAAAPEVIAIAQHVKRQFTNAAREQLSLRIDAHVHATRGMDAEARRQVRPACPLLEDGRCTVYPVRPISCRGWNSLDRSLCDADLAEPTRGMPARLNLAQYVLGGRVAEGIAAACHSLGLEHRGLDLVCGLRKALADPEGTARDWRSGADVFAEAVNASVFPGPRDGAEEEARARLWSTLEG